MVRALHTPPPSAVADPLQSFITFMNAPLISASDRTLRDAVPGLVVPQRAIAPAGGSALTLYTERGVMQVGWLQSLPFNTTLGVRLCDALAQGPAADYVPRGPGPTAKQFEFVVHVRGCFFCAAGGVLTR